MTLTNKIKEHFQESLILKQQTEIFLIDKIVAAGMLLVQCLKAGGKVLVCGNGGSAADAQHFAAEFANRLEVEREPLAAVALTTDTSILTAIGNDYSFDLIFAKQIKALGKFGDILIVISTSGNSKNVIEAIKVAQQKAMKIIALTGGDGGVLAPLLTKNDIELRVPAKKTMRIQEMHILILHCLCYAVDHEMILR